MDKRNNEPLLIEGFSDISQKTEVDCSTIDKDKTNTMVILAFGQANAANSTEVEYNPKHNVFNIFKNKCYKADDPLLGASATTEHKGSVWSRLGDKIIEAGMYENVVIKSLGVAGSPIECWTVNGTGIGWGGILQGNYHSRIVDAKKELDALGFTVTHCLFHQGEADTLSGTKTEAYKKSFINMLNGMRKNGINAPIYVALASRFYNQISPEIIAAQKQLIDSNIDILEGPNTDIIDKLDDRTARGCHFSDSGAIKHADAWLESLQKQIQLETVTNSV